MTPQQPSPPAHERDSQALRQRVEHDAEQIERAQRERRGVLGYTVMLGTVAGIFIVPVVAGAYLGIWLDERAPGYSTRWTVSLIVLGVATGAYNVYRYVRERW